MKIAKIDQKLTEINKRTPKWYKNVKIASKKL